MLTKIKSALKALFTFKKGETASNILKVCVAIALGAFIIWIIAPVVRVALAIAVTLFAIIIAYAIVVAIVKSISKLD